MAQSDGIIQAQLLLEDKLAKRMNEFESQLTAAKGNSNNIKIDALCKEFQDFRVFVVEMLSLLRQQIADLQNRVDNIEARNRRNCLLFKGIQENTKENIEQTIITIIQEKFGISEVTTDSLVSCYRLGKIGSSSSRPVLVRFTEVRLRQLIWSNKTKLKGTLFSCYEFLVKSRQQLFLEARELFGVKNCWTRDGMVIVKLLDGSRRKLLNHAELLTLGTSPVAVPEQSQPTTERPRRAQRKAL